MVNPYFEWLFIAFEIMAEVFKGADEGEEFFVINVVIEFGFIERLRMKGNSSDNHGLGIPAGLAGRVAGGAGAGLKFQPATNPHP